MARNSFTNLCHVVLRTTENWLLTGSSVQGSNSGGTLSFRTVQIGFEAHSATYTIGTGSFMGIKRQERGAGHACASDAGLRIGRRCISLYLFYYHAMR